MRVFRFVILALYRSPITVHMSYRIQLPDGTYCYTRNCSRHDPQKVTLRSYQNQADLYRDNTPTIVDGPLKIWLDRNLVALPSASTFFELGSGTGRDAEYLKQSGFLNVTCSDTVPDFVTELSKHHRTFHVDVLKGSLPEKADVFLANAVLLHFRKPETLEVMKKVHQKLNRNGRFMFSLKLGVGERWSDEKLGEPRFFSYWTAGEVRTAAPEGGHHGTPGLVAVHCLQMKLIQVRGCSLTRYGSGFIQHTSSTCIRHYHDGTVLDH